MAFDVINTGTTANDGTGDPLRTAFTKVNDNTAKAVEAPTGTVTADTVVLFDGTTGKLVKGGGKVNADLVTGPASSTDGTVVQFDGTSGKVVKASSVPVADIIVEGDARLTDSRTPVSHGNEAHTSTFVDAAGAAAAAPVQSVNTQTGAVVLAAADVGAYADTNPSSFVDAAGAAAAAPVQSVNTLTGAVVLDAAAVGADPTGTAASEVSTHNSDTTSVHGIADTATLVVGPASATDNSVAVYDGTTGKLLKDGTGTVTAGKFAPTATTVTGRGMYAPASNEVAFSTNGVERLRILDGTSVVFGNGDTATTPAATVVRGTNASGTNVAGPAMTIQAGRGTGTGAGGSLSFQTAAAGTTGSSLNAATTRLFINAAGQVGIANTAPLSGMVLHATGNVHFGAVSANVPTGYVIFDALNKNSIATSGTAVIEITTRDVFNTAWGVSLAEVDVFVSRSSNPGGSEYSVFKYLITNNSAQSGSQTLTRLHAGLTLVDDVADFAVTRPSARVMRITYTNPNAVNVHIAAHVRGNTLTTVSIT